MESRPGGFGARHCTLIQRFLGLIHCHICAQFLFFLTDVSLHFCQKQDFQKGKYTRPHCVSKQTLNCRSLLEAIFIIILSLMVPAVWVSQPQIYISDLFNARKRHHMP